MGALIGPSYPILNTVNGFSPFWADMPDAILADPNIGYMDTWDPNTWGDYPSTSGQAYTSATSGAWNGFTTYAYQGGTVVDAGLQGGGAAFASDGDNEGVYISRLSAPFLIKSTTRKLCLEGIFQTSTVTDTKHNIYFGLMEPLAAATGQPVSTSDALIDKDQIGFLRCASSTTGNGALVRAHYKKAGQTAQMFTTAGVVASDTTNVTTSVVGTLTAATNFKLGIKFEVARDGLKNLKVYYNGSEVGMYASAANIAAATFPTDKQMAMVFGVMNATGTTPGNTTLIKARCGQIW